MSTTIQIDLKTQKYDRQLRLWAADGQKALEDANICLLNASPTGCEILKNLILPGAGKVTVVDEALVTKQDIQTNFFLDPESIGQPRANSAGDLLQELNEDCIVSTVDRNPTKLIKEEPDFFEKFTMVIAINLSQDDALPLSELCHSTEKPLLLVKSKGLVGMFRLQAPEHTVIETHPENATDLRLSCPFQQLKDYVETFDLKALDQTDHAHVPYVIVLLKYVDDWKKEHDGQAPKTYAERKELGEMIKAGMRTPDEENFEEAVANLWRLTASTSISSEVRAIFEDASCQTAHSNSPHFWILARAVRDFVENEGGGQLPLSGKLPDMKSDTLNYIGLQKVYREKALGDLEAVTKRVKALTEGSEFDIPTQTIESFCKNAASIKVVQYNTLKESKSPHEKLLNWVRNDENICYYLVYKAADIFEKTHHRLPNSQEDRELLKQETVAVLKDMGITLGEAEEIVQSDTMDKSILNYVRFGDLETPNIAALLGGLVSQEAIKLITHQYIPINNTCIFNGITSTSSVFEL